MFTRTHQPGLRVATALAAVLLVSGTAGAAPAAEAEPAPARPTPQQVAWHDMEIEMFLCLDPCTWQGREYDNHSTPPAKINPAKLDTDQWADVAKSMGAGQIVFVAKHTGGFCWWQTQTSDYGVRNIPWRGGKGDVVAMLAASCRKRGLKLGIYLSPADKVFGAGVGGRCKTPQAQKKYNQVYRKQLTELLSRYGQVAEVWFDGSLVVDVGDILKKHTPKAMVFQGPHATIRWVGNESGVAPYPAWNGVSAADARSGVATARHGRPDGTAWLPLECDARIRSTWFWNPRNAGTLKSLDQLMEMYYRSVGHGAVLLLNNTPDTTGLIPAADVKRSAEFGAEIRRRFGKPLAQTQGKGRTLEIDLARPTWIDHVITAEDIRQGERVGEYTVEGLVGENWQQLAAGTAVGHKKIDRLVPVRVSKVRLRVVASAAEPAIRQFAVYDADKEDPKVAAKLAKPTPQQVEWADCEIGMFIHFAPNTWQDQEYDNHSTPLKKINPARLDTDQWVAAAEAMGAKYIIFVAKHVGGFCMWQTETTDYGVRSIPWRGGKGDVLADLARSCRKRGVKLGVYLSPHDRKQGAGGGGRCKTKEAQDRYNTIYRRQLTEVLSGYGEMFEVWFDGSNVVPLGDILAKHAPKAMVFQGPHATIRWVGNEAGVAPYPAWNSVSRAAGKSGVATARHGDPNGTAWLPNECDARIRANWFWNTRNAPTLKSVDQLMDMYYRSVGHGAVLLLNHTPDTTGLIPAADVKRGAEFAAEVRRRFGKPLARTAGRGKTVVLKLPRGAAVVDHVITMEDIAAGERVREYVVEGKVGVRWREICRGTSVGHKKIDRFGPVSVSALRLRVLKAATTPMIRDFSAYRTGTVAAGGEFLGHWKLDRIVKGCVTDSLGRQEPAKVHGATLVPGRSGKAMRFDGRRSYVSLGKADVMDRNFTIAAWIRPAATTPGGPRERFILSKERSGVGPNQMRLYLGAADQPGFMLCDAGAGHIWPFEAAGVKVPHGKWSHLAVTRKATLFTMYLDGRKIASKKSPGTISHLNSLSLRLGARHAGDSDGPDSVFAGDIDDLVILGSALGQEQIGELKDGKLPPIPAAGKKPADREFRVAGKWSGETVKGDWSDWTIDIAPFCNDAGQFEVVFRKTAGPGGIEVKAVTAIFGQVEASRHVERAKAPNTFYVNVPGMGTTLKLRATVRLGGRAKCSGRVLIRRMPGK